MFALKWRPKFSSIKLDYFYQHHVPLSPQCVQIERIGIFEVFVLVSFQVKIYGRDAG